LDVAAPVRCMTARAQTVSALLLGALAFLSPFSIDVSLPGLPAIAATIGAHGGIMQWTLAAYVLATGSAQLCWGPLADRYGRRPVVIVGLALYAAAGLACAAVTNVGALVALRFVQGVGSCAGSVCAFAIVHDLALAPSDRAARQATISAINNIGPLAAPVAGVAILTWLGWRALYAVPALLGALLLAFVVLRLPETGTRSAGSVGARYRRVLRLPRTVLLAATTFALFAGYFAMISGSPFVLVAQARVSTVVFAAAFATEAASALFGSFAANRLARRVPSETLLAAALALALGAALLNAAAGILAPSPPAFVATMSLYAFAFGVALPSIFALALARAGTDAGVASGLIGAALSLGGAAGSALGGSLPFAPSSATGAVVAAGAALAALCYALSRRALGHDGAERAARGT
jgi:DHA1 family bicyclomycin/chloramphenicol resistance-like MFS transporter